MKTLIVIVSLVCFLFSCSEQKNNANKKTLSIQNIKNFDFHVSIRALEVVDENEVWFAGAKGVFGYTDDEGETWFIDSLKYDGKTPSFRSIARTKKSVFLMSIASPALLYKSDDKGRSWDIVYQENDSLAFYDAMAFWDDQEGIAMGDPIGGCLSVIITRNGGKTWGKLPCDMIPEVVEGEAAFAASNSNIALYGDHAWIVSGGKKARVFHSADRGRHWEVFETPIVQGSTMTGIFSVDFKDENNGIIFGGNWDKQDDNFKNKAISIDGGNNWKLIADGKHPGYRSCVQFFPEKNSKRIIAVGMPGISYSEDFGQSWKSLSKESFYTVRFGKNEKTIWVAGNKKIGKIIWE